MPYSVTAPNEKAFGTEQDAYLKSLLTTTGDPTADAVNRLNLGFQASGNDPDEYKKLYLQYLQNQNAGAGAENNKDAAVAYINSGANLAKEGVAGAIMPPANNPYLRVDPNRLTASDAQHQQGMVGENVKNVGAGLKDLAEAGKLPDDATISGYLTPSIQRTPAPVSTYLSPGNKAKGKEADAAMLAAEAAMLHSQKYDGHQGGAGESVQTTFVSDGKGGFVPIGRTVTDKTGKGAVVVPPVDPPVAHGRLERDPKTNQLHWVPASK
jgi:hypothetical protein